jgi:hypothetical protein
MNRQNKYRNKPTTIDGVRFSSKLEAKRYGELKLLERAGEIRDLRLQPRFPLMGTRGPLVYESGRKVVYVADFDYVTRAGEVVIEDAKGMLTDAFKLKRALMKDRGLTVTLVK